MNKLIYWGIPLVVFVGVIVAGSSYFGIETVSEDPYNDASSISSDPSDTAPSVLSGSTDTNETSREATTTAPSYEQILASATERCRQAGHTDGTGAMDACVERETSQVAH